MCKQVSHDMMWVHRWLGGREVRAAGGGGGSGWLVKMEPDLARKPPPTPGLSPETTAQARHPAPCSL